MFNMVNNKSSTKHLVIYPLLAVTGVKNFL